jgi:AraC-like DNA-binding protein
VIPKQLLLSRTGATRLRDVDDRITAALDRNGYTETSYFSVPDGFALVTRLEQFEPDGTPKGDPDRWSLSPPRLRNFSLSSYLKALLMGQPGHYRVIAFIVTPRAFSQANVQVTPEQASEWLADGLNQLPEPIGDLDFSRAGYACTALIYEFERATDSDGPKVRVPGGLSGLVHLQKAGLWGTLNQ